MPVPKSLRRPLTRSLLFLAVVTPTSFNAQQGSAGERPTFNHTADPRPDILPHPFYYAHTEYRRAYNRPRYWSGWIADKIAVNSQEAMTWQENLAAGRYNGKHCPPMYKTYYYPKPWEAMQTGPRPDFYHPDPADPRLRDQPTAQPDVPKSGIEIVPQPIDDDAAQTSSRRIRTSP